MPIVDSEKDPSGMTCGNADCIRRYNEEVKEREEWRHEEREINKMVSNASKIAHAINVIEYPEADEYCASCPNSGSVL